jgi:hypothetical protein
MMKRFGLKSRRTDLSIPREWKERDTQKVAYFYQDQ